MIVADAHRVETGADRLENLLDVFSADHAPDGLAHLLHDAAFRLLELAIRDVAGHTVSADEGAPAVQAVGRDGEVAYIHLDVASDTTTGAQTYLKPSCGALTRASLVEGVADALRILGDEKLRIVAADDLVGRVPEQVTHLSIGEGEMAFRVEDVDKIGTPLDESPIAGLRQCQLLQSAVTLRAVLR
ncbi:MAG TPA: hypothetical protein QGF95_03560 [Candidatus Latescibacteria bacterium]|nr:hypothetical protein [Candidatus Latescibacterota bacterium]HJP29613.1 hypothetical protein [Candidatus Latescibacterota bacterium]